METVTEHGWKEVTIGPCRLIQADCLEALRSMPDGSVDCVVTSPPYNQLGERMNRKPGSLGMHEGGGWITAVNEIGYEDDMPEPEYQAWLNNVVSECLRVSKGLVWVNHKIRYRDGESLHPARFLPFPLWSEVVWDRGGSMALNCKRYAPSHEGLWGFGKPHYWDDRFNTRMSVWRVAVNRDAGAEFHPCPFPKRLVTPLVISSCPEGGTVLDPFNGAATSGVVCVETGRRYVGIEKREDYFAGSVKRIRAAVQSDRSSLWPAFNNEET